jgi:molybdenum cofactor guanylyltransferase
MKNTQQKQIAAIILAGGKSTRMGQDKALLTTNNCSLLTHVCTVAQDSLNWVYVVTPWVAKYRELIPSRVQLIPETIVLPDTDSNCPLIGFYQGLQQVTAEWVLLLACDLPKLNSTAIKHWCQELTRVPDSAIAFLPRSDKGWEPLCGFYRRSCLPLLEDYIGKGGKSFQTWLARHPVTELVLSDRSILFNCNTWEDWLLVSG